MLEAQFDKALHVSPFMGMDHRIARGAVPAERCRCTSASSRADNIVFDATLALRRRELTGASMAA